MDYPHLLTFLMGIFAIFGVQTSHECSGDSIRACSKELNGIKSLGQLSDMNTKEVKKVCSAVRKAVDCFLYATSTCSAGKKLVAVAAKSLNSIKEGCEKIASGDMDNVEACNATELEKCAADLKKYEGLSYEAKCLALGHGRQCLNNFKKNCQLKFILDLVDNQEEVLDLYEDECKTKGYPTGEMKQASETEMKPSDDGIGSGTMIKPTFLTLVASIILVLQRHFL